MDIAVLISDDLTTLGAIGPLEVLARLPDANVRIIAKARGKVRAGIGSRGLGLAAGAALEEAGRSDILLWLGGLGTDVSTAA